MAGLRSYEQKDYLGNVRVVISDELNTNGTATASAAYQYYAFGSPMPGRYGLANLVGQGGYRYGFNGKEKDDDLTKTTGTTYDYGFRIYDARIGKFLSVDPLTGKFPWYTPYQFAGNKPIVALDLDGLEEWYYWKSFVGWTASTKVSGPYSEESINKYGYYNAMQVHKIEQDKIIRAKLAEKSAQREAAYKVQQFNEWAENRPQNNPAYGALEFFYQSTVGGAVQSVSDFSEGSYGWGTFNALTSIFGIFELKELGILGRGSSFAQAVESRSAGGFRLSDINKVEGNMNCVNCAIATDNLLKGTPSSALNSGATQLGVLESFYGTKFTHGLNIEGVNKLIPSSGKRGIVFGNRGNGKVGHVFNVVNQEGTIRFLDGQTGKAADLSGYKDFSFLPTN